MRTTFTVDDVAPATEPPVTKRLGDVLSPALATSADLDAPVVDVHAAHPLIGAVHHAFSEHRPLVLSPDAVWLTIAQGLAQHVRLHAEALRPRLVRHTGKARLTVTHVGSMPTTPDGWGAFITSFRDGVAEHIGQGLARLFTCDFSTSTTADRVASEVVLLDAMSAYFDYFLYGVCGIPRITLLGTPEDWRRIRERVDVLAELDCALWARSLVPITDELVRASEGRPDIAFWQHIYKPRKAYGWDRVTGWIARLYPYLEGQGSMSSTNPLLELPIDQPNDGTEDEWYEGPGVGLRDIRTTWSTALVRVSDEVAGRKYEVQIEAGLLGVAVESDGGLRPFAGWMVRERSTSILDVLERIVREHETTRTKLSEREAMIFSGNADVMAMRDHFDGATLFSGPEAWTIRPWRARDRVELRLPNGRTTEVVRLIDLPGDRFIGMDDTRRGPVYCLGDATLVEPYDPARTGGIELRPRTVCSREPANALPVIGKALGDILAYALEHGGAVPPPTGQVLVDCVDPWLLQPLPAKPAERPRRK
jgi:hypothetical protein